MPSWQTPSAGPTARCIRGRLPRRCRFCPFLFALPDPDVLINLGAVFAIAYQRGADEREIDYALPPPVSVSGERQQWIGERIQAARG